MKTLGTQRSLIRFRSTAVRVSGETGPSSLSLRKGFNRKYFARKVSRSILLVVLKKVFVYFQPGLLPLDIEVETVGDGEVSVVNDKNVTDVDLNVYQVGLNNNQQSTMTEIYISISTLVFNGRSMLE